MDFSTMYPRSAPDKNRACTSHVERQNLTIRMQMRRLTRLTNAFSKKWENLWAAYCLHFAFYNFCRIHRTLRVTPAMAAGVTGKVWDLADLMAAACGINATLGHYPVLLLRVRAVLCRYA